MVSTDRFGYGITGSFRESFGAPGAARKEVPERQENLAAAGGEAKPSASLGPPAIGAL